VTNNGNKSRHTVDERYIVSPNILRRQLIGDGSPFAVAEAYKAARTNLMFMRTGDGCQKIAITSSLAGEGKSINCMNVGIALAQSGQRVLLVDADMRRSVVRRTFSAGTGDGLSELLAGVVDRGKLNDFIIGTDRENLSILPAGHMPPNPAELLASKQMGSLLGVLSERYDYILIDTPPVSVVTDAVVLSRIADGFLLVVRAGNTPIDSLKDSVSQLERVGAHIIGFLFNDVNEKKSGRKYGKYSYYGNYDNKSSVGQSERHTRSSGRQSEERRDKHEQIQQ
jgi:capsular exopolysaccharide synthesis family protein